MKELMEFYNIFSVYNKICIYNIDEQFYYCTKDENKALKRIYKIFNIDIPYQQFKSCAVNLAINDHKNIITSAMKVIEIIKE